MAPKGSCPCYFSHRNLPPINHIEDELARDLGPADGSHFGSISYTLFCNSTLGPALLSTLIPALILVLAPASGSLDELFRQFMKAYLES